MNRRSLRTFVIGGTLAMSLLVACGAPGSAPSATPAVTSVPPTPTNAHAIPPKATSVGSQPAPNALLIFDDDGSRDGMAALLYLLGYPEIPIGAVSISYGEAHPAVYVQHAGRVLDLLGHHDIPLGAGQDAPLAGGTPFPQWLRELSDNFWGISLPNGDKTLPVSDAPQLMVSTINKAPQPVTVFISGPFTNLAQALRLDPGIKDGVAAVYFMGGAVYSPGNITNLMPDSDNRVAEWNIYADPQAAKEVLESGLELYMVPLDATGQVILTPGDILPWHAGGQTGDLAADLYDIMFEEYGLETVEIFDLTAAAIMARPELCVFQRLHLDVITEDGKTLGQTVLVPDASANIHVCLDPDVDQIKEDLERILSRSAEPIAPPPIDRIVGTWEGSAFNNGFEMQVSIVIEAACELGQICGRFDIPTASCSGTLTWIGTEGDLYHFQAGDKSDACGEGDDYLSPQADGTIRYISRGDYGETLGTLQRLP